MRLRFADWSVEDRDIGRVFVRCRGCQRVRPYYQLSGRQGQPLCRCGSDLVSPAILPTWQAIGWLLWATLSRQPDPRMPIRTLESRYG